MWKTKISNVHFLINNKYFSIVLQELLWVLLEILMDTSISYLGLQKVMAKILTNYFLGQTWIKNILDEKMQ